MPKHPASKRWDATHRDKGNEYYKKYINDKLRVNLVLDNETAVAINKLYPEDISMPAKIKAILKTWIEQNTKPS